MSARNAIKGKQLYRILFFGVIFAVLAVGTLAFWGVREIRRDAASVAVESAARGLSGTIAVLLDAVVRSNDEIGAQVLANLEPEVLRREILGVLEKHAVLTGVVVSDGSGLLYELVRSSEGAMETVAGSGRTLVKPDGTTVVVKNVGSEQLKVRSAALVDEYRHLKPGQINWRSTDDVLDASGQSCLSASTLVESGGRQIMASFFFPVEVVVNHLGRAEKGSAEKIFLYWHSGRVLPIASQDTDKGRAGVVAEVGADPVVGAAARILKEGSRALNVPFAYDVDDEVWWGYAMPLSVFGDTISLGVAVPRRNIVSLLTGDTFLQVFGGALVLMAAMALLVLHRNKARIEAIGVRHKTPRTAQDLLRLVAEGEGNCLEFKQTLRFNLKSGKNGREIEHACLKTVAGFLNSAGGILLIGVADSGEVVGFEEDRFANADKALLHLNNLVNQHIGTEFSRYLESVVIEAQGKSVLAVHCLTAAAPAFLDMGKNEEFYVRSGPASRQLTLSQFYEWLQNH